MTPLQNLLGQKFGRLTVIKRATTRVTKGTAQHRTYWLCRCDCGKELEIVAYSLTRGVSKSCGCFRNEFRSCGINENLEGGTITHGYHSVTVNHKRLLAHRVIMERYLGRPLLATEIVHHLNGIRNDNRIKNLAIVTQGSHQHGTMIKMLQKRIRELEAELSQGKIV